MKLKITMILFCLALAVPAFGGKYNYVSPEQVNTWLSDKTPVNIVDIQVAPEFNEHHLPGSLATHAYPVKTEKDRKKLDKAIVVAKGNNYPVIVVCPRGKGGAKRSYDYMKAQNLIHDRLMILEGGIDNWPFEKAEGSD